MKITYFLFIFWFLFSCSSKTENEKLQKATKIQKIDTASVYVDSVNIGVPKRNKILLTNIIIDDSIPKVQIKFYSKENEIWKIKCLFEDEQWLGDIILPETKDFNNDGYNDFKYMKGRGARGGNGIYNLFIFDKKADSIKYVLNSNEYPNLYFNRQTNSINSFILTGGNETVFMKLDSNKLKPFASISQYDKEITVIEYDNLGRQRTIKVDTTKKYKDFEQFTNYNPLTVEK